MMKKFGHGELAKSILRDLAVEGVILVNVFLKPMTPHARLFYAQNSRERQRIRQSLFGLEKKGLIVVKSKNSEPIIMLTERGREKILKYDFEDLQIDKPKKWDGLWRVVIFDIAEAKKRARDQVAWKLKDLGFYQLQKSTYVFPYDCKAEVDLIKEFCFARGEIIYMVVKNIENDYKIKTFFRLRH